MAHLAQIDPKGEVFPITCDWELGFAQPATRKALAYWRQLCAGRRMPIRRELKPRAMREFLDHVNLVDVIPQDDGGFDFMVTLQGAQSFGVFGHMAGQTLSEILPPVFEKRWSDSFELPRMAAAPVRLVTRASTFGKKWLGCEGLLAPLGDGPNSVTSIFWVFASWRI
jgi:hypothetical protein